MDVTMDTVTVSLVKIRQKLDILTQNQFYIINIKFHNILNKSLNFVDLNENYQTNERYCIL